MQVRTQVPPSRSLGSSFPKSWSRNFPYTTTHLPVSISSRCRRGPRRQAPTLQLAPRLVQRGWVSAAELGRRRVHLQAAGPARCQPGLLPASGRAPQEFREAGAAHLRLRPPGQGPSRGGVSWRQRPRGRSPGVRWETPCPRAAGEVGRIRRAPKAGDVGLNAPLGKEREGARGAESGEAGAGRAIKGRADARASAIAAPALPTPRPRPSSPAAAVGGPTDPHPCPASSARKLQDPEE